MPAVNPQTLSSLMDGTQVPENSFDAFQQPYFDKYGVNPYQTIIGGNSSDPWSQKRSEFHNRWNSIAFQGRNPYYNNGTPEQVMEWERNKQDQFNALRNDMNSFFKVDPNTGYENDAIRLQSDIERYAGGGDNPVFANYSQLSPLINTVNKWSPNNTWNTWGGRTPSEIGLLGKTMSKNTPSPTSSPSWFNQFYGQLSAPLNASSATQTYSPRTTQSSGNRKRRWYEGWQF